MDKGTKATGLDIEELQRRLEEAEQTIEAICSGQADAVVRQCETGSQVYTLEGPDRPYRNIVETMYAGAVTTDPDGVIFYANGAFSEMVGVRLEKLIGNSFQEHVVPDEVPGFLDFLRRTSEGERASEEVRLRRPTGVIYVKLAGSSQTNYGVERIAIVVTDISDLKSAEESLRRSHGELRQGHLNLIAEIKEREKIEEQLGRAQKLEAVGTLAGGIAHDFNNMLAVILGNAELALDDLNDNDVPRRNVQQIIKASKRARELVKQILAFSRKTEGSRKAIRLGPLIKETYALLRASLPTTIDIQIDLADVHDNICADPTQIQQVLMNLSTNAAHTMRQHGGTLTIGLTRMSFTENDLPDRELSPGSYVKLWVRDTGRGIPAEIRGRIFDPFFTTKPPDEGSGMGLAVVYGIVKNHEGVIMVESEPGKGSTFTIYLPLSGRKAQEETKEKGHVIKGNEHILLADDEEHVLKMTSEILRKLGYEVTAAPSGTKALDLFLDDPRRFDLLITDQTMPQMTGISLAEKVLEKRKDIPIILFTGYSEIVSPEKAKEAGIREFVMKPVTKQEIATTVRKVLDEWRNGQMLE